MANSVVKTLLSGSTDGRGIKVVATATPGTTIHTATASTTTVKDELWLWAMNSSAGAIQLNIEFGGVSSPDDKISVAIPAVAGLVLVVPGLVLQNGAVVRAFAGTANVVMVHGFVNRITNS